MADGSCSSSESSTVVSGGGIKREIMLFGVRVVLDPMRKSVSLNNLSQYDQAEEIPKIKISSGYASADDAVPISSSGGIRERKRGIYILTIIHTISLIL